MSAFSEDMLDLLSLFLQKDVRFLIVGAHAVNAYTEARMTKDLDLWVDSDPENSNKVYQALAEFGAPLQDLTAEAFTDKESFFVVGVKPNRIDILMSIPGLEFSNAWPSKGIVKLDHMEVPVLSLDDVITAKKAAGRPQDLLDLKKLMIFKKMGK
jgi:predicted nucleotidyltransferase